MPITEIPNTGKFACFNDLWDIPEVMTTRAKKRWMIGAISGCCALVLLGVILPDRFSTMGADLILHPFRKPLDMALPSMCEEVDFEGEGVILKGWRCQAVGARRGTLIYLHGVSDNRSSGVGIMERFRKRGFDVLIYDSRAHGESGGTASTFGFFEKKDLRHVIDTVESGPIVLIGSSLGAAVALQLAAEDRRISAVVGAECFSDLRTVLTERAPFFFSANVINKAIKRAEEKGQFEIDLVSPLLAAQSITAPVMLIHGEDDTDTLPDHSQRIFRELTGPKHLILVPGAGHNESLAGNVWEQIEQWVDATLRKPPVKAEANSKE